MTHPRTTIQERIGLFGGTFNPIHFGHLRGAEEICEKFQLDKVIFIPARIPPHKNGGVVTAPEHRLAMVQIGIHNNPAFAATDFEISQDRVSYTILTVRYFRKGLGTGSKLFFLLGMDSFRELTTWKDYAQLFDLTNFVVMSRPGYSRVSLSEVLPVDVAKKFDYNPKQQCFEHVSGNKIFFQEITLLEIASRTIRTRIRNQQSVRYLMPRAVVEYIERHRLYRI